MLAGARVTRLAPAKSCPCFPVLPRSGGAAFPLHSRRFKRRIRLLTLRRLLMPTGSSHTLNARAARSASLPRVRDPAAMEGPAGAKAAESAGEFAFDPELRPTDSFPPVSLNPARDSKRRSATWCAAACARAMAAITRPPARMHCPPDAVGPCHTLGVVPHAGRPRRELVTRVVAPLRLTLPPPSPVNLSPPCPLRMDAAYHSVTAMVGAGVLGLPAALGR